MSYDFDFEHRQSDSPLVEAIWRTETESAGSFISAAATHFGMVITKYAGQTTITMRGPETRATPADFPAGAEFFGINFKLGTFMPHLPPKLLIDRRDLHLPETASDKSFWLHGSSWQVPTFENVDTFVDRLLRQGLIVHEPVVDAVIQGRPQTLSIRSVQYRFLTATGLTLSTIRQIERARQATALLESGIPILDAAFETGYFDQAHLTRSMKRFMGQTPAQIVRSKEFV